MKRLQKEYFGIKSYQLLLVLLIALLGIIFGSFFDLKISLAIASTQNWFGRFCETLGETLGYLMAPCFGAIFFKALFRKENKVYEKIIGIVMTLVSILAPAYYYGNSLSSYSGYSLFDLPRAAAYIVSTILMLISFAISYRLIDKNVGKRELLYHATVMLACFALTLLLVNFFMKKAAYRPRYRAMAFDNPSVGTLAMGLEHYQEWWQFNWFKKPSWFADEGNTFHSFSDYIKSWPSGHTATASTLMLLPVFAEISIFRNKKNVKTILFFVGLAYALIIALARILAGAHFLSDVSWGMLSFLFVSYISLQIGNIFWTREKHRVDEADMKLD